MFEVGAILIHRAERSLIPLLWWMKIVVYVDSVWLKNQSATYLVIKTHYLINVIYVLFFFNFWFFNQFFVDYLIKIDFLIKFFWDWVLSRKNENLNRLKNQSSGLVWCDTVSSSYHKTPKFSYHISQAFYHAIFLLYQTILTVQNPSENIHFNFFYWWPSPFRPKMWHLTWLQGIIAP